MTKSKENSQVMHIHITEDVPSGCTTEQLARLITHHLAYLELHPDCEVSVSFVDETRMSELHVEWMNEPGPTDVLSFPMDELRSGDADAGILGDIVICPSFVERQASEKGLPLNQEVEFLLTHGMLHLIGYDHATEEEYTEMFALQDRLLTSWRAA